MILEKLRERAGDFFINKKLKNIRNVKGLTLDDSKEIGLLFEVSNEISAVEHIKDFVSYLINKRNIISTIGYCPLNNPPLVYTRDPRLNIFTKKDLNFYLFPKSQSIDNFLNKKFDILIDISSGKHVQLKYILAKSNALFKAGPYIEENKFYDLMIDTSKNDGNFEYYLEQLKYFLTNINYKS